MNQDNTQTHKTIFIDPAKFKDRVPTGTGTGTVEYIFGEGDVLKFLVDQLNAAGVDISLIHHNHEIAIEYGERVDYFGIGISSLDAPETAIVEGMAELSDMLNDYEGIESWVSYKDGKHCLHIAESEETAAEEDDIVCEIRVSVPADADAETRNALVGALYNVVEPLSEKILDAFDSGAGASIHLPNRKIHFAEGREEPDEPETAGGT